MILDSMHFVLANPMQECEGVPAHMVAFVHVVYSCSLSFCRPVITSHSYVIVITDGGSDGSQ